MTKEERKSFLKMQGMLLMHAETIENQEKRIAALESELKRVCIWGEKVTVFVKAVGRWSQGA